MDEQRNEPRAAAGPYSEETQAAETLGPTESLLCVTVAGLRLGFAVEQVQEIQEGGDHAAIPLAPPYVVGLMNLRGHAVPLMELATFFELPRGELQERDFGRVVIVSAAQMRVGLLVDHVVGVREIPSGEVHEPQVAMGQRLRQMARGELEHDGTLLLIIDLGRLLATACVGP